ncbi:multidrug effflux MFS transporter [Nitrincola sp. MINF-07-Sa-05]|uniref:multidrug effflux MFS transporter n=1 Tax=Nitrincola salilacus TaxID=3400273 RepID=UPI00391834B9
MSQSASSSKRSPGLIQGIVLVGLVAFSAISTDLYLSGLPAMITDLNSNHGHVQLTLSLFMLGYALGQIISGSLADSWGRMPVLKLGLVLFFLASLICIWAPTVEALWVGRILQGLGASVGPVLGRAIVSDVYPREDAAKVLAYLSSAMALIPALAPIIGSWLLIWFSWRSHFVALAAFSVITLIGVLLFLWETRPDHPEGQKRRFMDIFRNFPRFIKDRLFIAYVICASTSFGAMFAYISSSSYIITEVIGLSPQLFGYTFAANVMGYMIGAFSSARLVSRLGLNKTIGLGLGLLLLASLVMLLAIMTGWINLISVLFAMFLVFASGGLTLANSQAGSISLFREYAGSASAVFGLIQIGTAATTGALAGYFYNATVIPLTVIMSLCGLIGFAIWYWQLAAQPD